MPGRLLALLLVAASAAAGPAASGQATPEPVAAVTVDADGDGVPDRLGERVAVSAVAAVAEGTFGPRGASLYVQDMTGGVAVDLDGVRAPRRPVAAGDRVVVEGTVAFRAGVAVVEAQRVSADGAGGVPAPAPYTAADAEAVEGRLVRAEGTVAGVSQVDAGRALLLSLDDLSIVVVFAFEGQPSAVTYEGLRAGDRVSVVGVAGQYDRTAPYVDSHQIYPRAQADLRPVGLGARAYKRLALGAAGVLLVALVVVAALRVQVRRRVAALRASEVRYDALVERASDAVFVHDLRGATSHANRAARDALGLGPDDPVPPLLDLVHADDRPAGRAHLETVARTGNARTDFRLGPAEFEVESQAVEIDGQRRVLSLARDVSARRAYERGLIEAREQAEEAARSKSAFLANMSHEIRTPLTAVIGFAEVLQAEVGDDHRDLVEAIGAGGRRLLATLNSVLDVASLDARRHTLHPSPVDVVAEVQGVAEMLRPLADERGLALHVAAPSGPVPAVLDAGALGRIAMNLIDNAIKFTPCGAVTVEVGCCDGDAVLRVQDTGVGISEGFLPDLFEAFKQESDGHGRDFEGTGLGLAITKRLVDLMGGEVRVWSRKGEGTLFEVALPREAPAPDRPAALPDIPEAAHADDAAPTSPPLLARAAAGRAPGPVGAERQTARPEPVYALDPPC